MSNDRWPDRNAVDCNLIRPPDYAHHLIYAYGVAVLNWGHLEGNVDNALIVTRAEASVAGLPIRIPNAWRAKCEMLAARASLPCLQAMAAYVTSLAADLKEIGGERNLIVHAGAYGFSNGDPPLLHLRKLDFLTADDVRIRQVKAGVDDFFDFTDVLIGLGNRLAPVLLATVKASPLGSPSRQ